jgi:hypothetical protein
MITKILDISSITISQFPHISSGSSSVHLNSSASSGGRTPNSTGGGSGGMKAPFSTLNKYVIIYLEIFHVNQVKCLFIPQLEMCGTKFFWSRSHSSAGSSFYYQSQS